MAVLIRRNWAKLDDRSEAKVTAAFLPSGKILLSPDREMEREGFEQIINPLKEVGAGIDAIFGRIAAMYRTPITGDVYLVEDTDRARELIREGGLQ